MVDSGVSGQAENALVEALAEAEIALANAHRIVCDAAAALRCSRERETALAKAAERVLTRYRPRIYEFEGNGAHSELHDLAAALSASETATTAGSPDRKPT